MKYAISKEFFPLSIFKNPIRSARIAGILGSLQKTPKWIFKDEQISVERRLIKSYDGVEIEILIMSSKGNNDKASPCIVYLHGGGFVFAAGDQHYKLVKEYVLRTPTKAVFVNYRLAPKYPHPTPVEDCYCGLRYAFEHADEIGIDKSKIGVGGDSAGGALSAAVCLMARDRRVEMPAYQMLIYPATDMTMNTDSNRRFTDTPVWNSTLSKMMWPAYVPDKTRTDLAYASPMLAKSFAGLPSAYVELAEFDCLRDEAINYAEAMKREGVEVEIVDTKGTMHGFDGKFTAPTTQKMIESRVGFLKRFI